MLYVIAGALLAIVAILVVVGMTGRRDRSEVAERLSQYAERPLTLEEIEFQKPFRERVLIPMFSGISNFVSRRMPKQTMERLRLRLEMAGNPMQAGTYMVLQVGCAVVLGVLAFVILGLTGESGANRFLYALALALVGYVLPVVWLNGHVNGRKKAILKALPDAIDLLTISVEAGLGFDLAMQRVAEKWDNDLSREFARVLADIRLGKNRRDALRELTIRTGVPDLSTFVAAVIQADQLGVSIAKILRVQSDQLRIRRRQRAEELAHQAPIKMMFPLVFLIFPSMFVVILGPAAPTIYTAFFPPSK